MTHSSLLRLAALSIATIPVAEKKKSPRGLRPLLLCEHVEVPPGSTACRLTSHPGLLRYGGLAVKLHVPHAAGRHPATLAPWMGLPGCPLAPFQPERMRTSSPPSIRVVNLQQ